MVGGLERQVKEMKEVIELPIKHPELFEALGIAQPKGVIMYGPPVSAKLAELSMHLRFALFNR
jgi:26S proteasome regulatory subunit T6